LFLAFSSSYDDDSTSSGLSTGVIAGISVGGAFFFLLFGTSLIVAIICLRHHYIMKKQSQSCDITQQQDQQALVATAPSPLSYAYNPTFPTVDSPPDGSAFHQFSGSPQPAGQQPEYFPGSQPQYTPGGFPSDPQSGYASGPSPADYAPN